MKPLYLLNTLKSDQVTKIPYVITHDVCPSVCKAVPYKKEDYFLCPKSMPHKGYLNWRSLDYFLIRDFF